jgi:hypothetical protein
MIIHPVKKTEEVKKQEAHQGNIYNIIIISDLLFLYECSHYAVGVIKCLE